jgi:hypothetical protein
MIFEKFSHELIAGASMETEVKFLRGMEVPDSYRGMETIGFG